MILIKNGKIIEKNHYKNIRSREIMLIKKPYLTYGNKILDDLVSLKKELINNSYYKNSNYLVF